MAKHEGYLSAKESRRISKENRRITNELEKKRKRKRQICQMKIILNLRIHRRRMRMNRPFKSPIP